MYLGCCCVVGGYFVFDGDGELLVVDEVYGVGVVLFGVYLVLFGCFVDYCVWVLCLYGDGG